MGVGTYVGSPAAYDLVTRCQEAVHGCDETLLRITTPGALSVRVEEKTNVAPSDFRWLKVHLYRSDASGRVGEREPNTKLRGAADSKELTVERVTPGYYLVQVEYMEGLGEYSARATLRPGR